jgi:hypothetical protein
MAPYPGDQNAGEGQVAVARSNAGDKFGIDNYGVLRPMLRGKKLPLVSANEERQSCFRNMFIWEKDVEIGKIVEQCLLNVQKRWPQAWELVAK